MPKSLLDLAGIASWAELRMLMSKRRAKLAEAAREVSAAAADRRARATWFRGHADTVRLETGVVIEGDLDVSRAHVLYDKGLTVTGTLRLGASGSIVVVVGDLRVGRLQLGDDVLAVTGKVYARDYIRSRLNEGIFSVHGAQEPRKQLAHLRTPEYLAFDPRTRALTTYRAVRGKLVAGKPARRSADAAKPKPRAAPRKRTRTSR